MAAAVTVSRPGEAEEAARVAGGERARACVRTGLAGWIGSGQVESLTGPRFRGRGPWATSSRRVAADRSVAVHGGG